MPKIVDHEAREIEVAEAAWVVLQERGIQGLSVRNVAEAAGLAVGSLRRSFPSQQALMRFCIELVIQRASERIASIEVGSSALPHVEEVLAQVLPLDGQRRLEMEVWLALSIGSLSDPLLRGVCAANDRTLGRLCVKLVGTLADEALLAREDVDREAARLHALVDGLALQLIRQAPDASCAWATDVVARHLRSLTVS